MFLTQHQFNFVLIFLISFIIIYGYKLLVQKINIKKITKILDSNEEIITTFNFTNKINVWYSISLALVFSNADELSLFKLILYAICAFIAVLLLIYINSRTHVLTNKRIIGKWYPEKLNCWNMSMEKTQKATTRTTNCNSIFRLDSDLYLNEIMSVHSFRNCLTYYVSFKLKDNFSLDYPANNAKEIEHYLKNKLK